MPDDTVLRTITHDDHTSFSTSVVVKLCPRALSSRMSYVCGAGCYANIVLWTPLPQAHRRTSGSSTSACPLVFANVRAYALPFITSHVTDVPLFTALQHHYDYRTLPSYLSKPVMISTALDQSEHCRHRILVRSRRVSSTSIDRDPHEGTYR